jgi:hypothetical protein
MNNNVYGNLLNLSPILKTEAEGSSETLVYAEKGSSRFL